MDTASILKDALKLRPAERLELIEMLTRSLSKPDADIEKIWAEESERRYKALEEGRLKTYSINEIIQRYKQMQIAFTEPAAIEPDDAIEYYELEIKGLGKKFLKEVLETTHLISQFPQLFSKNSDNTRKAVLRKFPYNLVYSILNDKIYIIAVAHQNRSPEYWIDRVKD